MPISYRVYYRVQEKIEFKEFLDRESLLAAYEQVGVEETSYTLRLHNEPILRGLIGPMSEKENKRVVRYETPELFAFLSEKWGEEIERARKRTS